jgi:geranylgeranyl diphosphate synthase type II
MIGGQVADIEAEQRWPDHPERALEQIHRRKTGCLLEASLVLGGVYAAVDDVEEARLRRLGASIGLLFQIGDDLIDVLSTTEMLGKTAGKDANAKKLTYPGLYGIDESRRRLHAVAAEALELACDLPAQEDTLRSLIRYLGERDR